MHGAYFSPALHLESNQQYNPINHCSCLKMYNLICLPQDIWRDRIMPFVPSLRSIVRLDSAVNNKLCRTTFHNNICGMRHNWQVQCTRTTLKWFNRRNIAVHSIFFGKVKPKATFASSFLSMMRKITGTNALHHSRSFERTIRLHSCALTCLDIITNDVWNVSGLRYAKNLTRLSVRSCSNITSGSFVQAVRECTQLRVCTIEFCEQLLEAATAAVLLHCKELKELTVSEPANLDKIFSQITEPIELQKFVWYSSLACISSPSLRTIANQMPHIKHLDWSSDLRSESTATAEDFNLLLRNCKKIETLMMGGTNPLTNQSLGCMGESLTLLHQLTLGRCALITNAGIHALGFGCRFLAYLDLSENPTLTNMAIRDIGMFCRLLVHLNVHNCVGLTDYAFGTLNVAYLRELDVSGTLVTGAFTSHILQTSSRLHRLRCNACPNLHIRLLQALPPNNQLHSFTLEKLHLSHEDWLQLSALLPILHSLCLTACDNVDQTILRSFATHCSHLHTLIAMRCCPVSRQERKELKLWWEVRVGTSRQVTMIIR